MNFDTSLMTYVGAFKRRLIYKMANHLLEPTNQVTTLEIKNELRKMAGDITWNQADISAAMISLENNSNGNIVFEDTGTFRIYSKKIKAKKIEFIGSVSSVTVDNTPVNKEYPHLFKTGVTVVTPSGHIYRNVTIYAAKNDQYRCKEVELGVAGRTISYFRVDKDKISVT